MPEAAAPDFQIRSHGGTKPPIAPLDGSTSIDPSKEAAIKAARQRVVSRAAAAPPPPSEPEPIAEPREDIASVEVRLPNGRTVLFGPREMPASIRLAKMLPNATPLMLQIYSTLIYVQAIDGAPIAEIGNEVDAQKALNAIGDDGLDLLMRVSAKCWPAITSDDLPIVKKNLRD